MLGILCLLIGFAAAVTYRGYCTSSECCCCNESCWGCYTDDTCCSCNRNHDFCENNYYCGQYNAFHNCWGQSQLSCDTNGYNCAHVYLGGGDDGCDVCRVRYEWDCGNGNPGGRSVCCPYCGGSDSYIAWRVQEAEQCDDSNGIRWDGCRDCNEEPGWVCKQGDEVHYSYGDVNRRCDEVCGNNNNIPINSYWNRVATHYNNDHYSAESVYYTYQYMYYDFDRFACDDRNQNNGDGCDQYCNVEPNYICGGGTYLPPANDVCEICGNGSITYSQISECDDGGQIDGDGCNSKCEIETGWYCNGQPSNCYETCGDGLNMNDGGAIACDDGDTSSGDGCSNTCQVEAGWTCSGGNSASADVCIEICGDNYFFDGSNNNCDDGNKQNDDGCDQSCKVEDGWYCQAPASPWSNKPCYEICGDGFDFQQYGCDDGNPDNGDGCSTACAIETGWTCTGGLKQGPGDVCIETCGDGLDMQTYECDDGNNQNGDGCDSNCEIETGWYCNGGTPAGADECHEICGDGRFFADVILCDDGNFQDGDGCTWDCQIEDGYYCIHGNANTACVCPEICGDGKNYYNYECDDGNRCGKAEYEDGSNLTCVDAPGLPNYEHGDGCDSECMIEQGWECKDPDSDNLTADVCEEICGDGLDFKNYECDDANVLPYDGCDDQCVIELAYKCEGGDHTRKDECFQYVFRPKPELIAVTINNDIWLKFNDTMAIFNPITDLHIQVTIQGNQDTYQLDFNAAWVNNTHIFINTTIFDQLWGNEQIKIEWLDPAAFKNSPYLMNMINIPLQGKLYYKSKDEAKISEKTIDKVLNTKKAVGVLSGIAGAVSIASIAAGSPLSSMWNSVGSLQMVNVASVLDLYMPSTVKEFTDSLAFSNLKNENLNAFWNTQYNKAELTSHNYTHDVYGSLYTGQKESIYDKIQLQREQEAAAQSAAEAAIKEQAQQSASTRRLDLGTTGTDMDSTSISQNSGDVILLCLILLASVPLMMGALLLLRLCCKEKATALLREFRYNFFIRLGYLSFLWLFTAALMNAKTLNFTNTSEIMSSLFTLISFCYLSWIIIVTPSVVLFNPIEKLQTDSYLRSCYGTIYLEFKPTKTSMLYYTFYLIRRIIYSVLLAFRQGSGFTQLSILVTVCAISLVYHVMIFPYQRKVMNIIACLNEILITIIFACLIKFTSLNEEADDIDLMGWIVISVALAIVVINTAFIIVEKIAHTVEGIYSYVNKSRKGMKADDDYNAVKQSMETSGYGKDTQGGWQPDVVGDSPPPKKKLVKKGKKAREKGGNTNVEPSNVDTVNAYVTSEQNLVDENPPTVYGNSQGKGFKPAREAEVINKGNDLRHQASIRSNRERYEGEEDENDNLPYDEHATVAAQLEIPHQQKTHLQLPNFETGNNSSLQHSPRDLSERRNGNTSERRAEITDSDRPVDAVGFAYEQDF